MHEGEVTAEPGQVSRLIAAQFPHWAGLKLARMRSAGTDNTIYRLGDDKAVRLPRIGYAAGQIEKECEWLPKLAPLPLRIPAPLGRGEPGEGFPWRWAVHEWIEGETATSGSIGDINEAAAELARFVAALQRIDATGGPASGPANHGRGSPLARRDQRTREAIGALSAEYDSEELRAAWDQALAAPAFAGRPVWVHGDLHEGNLLQTGGRLVAVIDFGLLGVGDPAVDLTAAWSFFPAEARGVFRAGTGADDAAWARGRGWALSIALIALAYYLETNPALVSLSRRTIEAVMADR